MISAVTGTRRINENVAKVDRERLQVTEWVRSKLSELRSGSELTFRQIGKLWSVSNAYVTNLHNHKTVGVVGPQLERRIAELYFGGSIDDLRREARKIDVGEAAVIPASTDPIRELVGRYPNAHEAGQLAKRIGHDIDAIVEVTHAALASESDLPVSEWLAMIKAAHDRRRRDAAEPAREDARLDEEDRRLEEAKAAAAGRRGRKK